MLLLVAQPFGSMEACAASRLSLLSSRLAASAFKAKMQRFERGMKNLAKRLGKRRAPVDVVALAAACASGGCAGKVPEGLSVDVLQSMEASRGQRLSHKLAHCTLSTLAWLRWRRRFAIGYLAVNLLIAIVVGISYRANRSCR